jgi:hypothetical protein
VSEKHRAVAWVKEDPFGVEFTEVAILDRTLTASGVAIGSDPFSYRLDYTLETGEGFVTSRLMATAVGAGRRYTLDLRRSPAGEWSADTDLPELEEALDCDLGLSPLTNTMPVLRHGLLEGEEAVELLMAWVSVPDLAVYASAQRYTALGNRAVRYEGLDTDFTADLLFDEDGLVVDYPRLGRRLTSPSGGSEAPER